MSEKYPNIDYAQRPKDYWGDSDVLASLLRNVKGTERRKMIRAYWKDGCLEELSEELLKDTLTKETRTGLGRIHPMFMGGEYLPDYSLGEVEIARIQLRSTTGDVISIRAAREPSRIRYRVVDEYDTEYESCRETSRRPLTLLQLIDYISGTWHPMLETCLPFGFNHLNMGSGSSRAEVRHFSSVSSELYPQLHAHYEAAFDDWVREGDDIEEEKPEITG